LVQQAWKNPTSSSHGFSAHMAIKKKKSARDRKEKKERKRSLKPNARPAASFYKRTNQKITPQVEQYEIIMINMQPKWMIVLKFFVFI